MTQAALGGHVIPLDRGALEVLAILGIISPAEAASGKVTGLERAIPKNKGPEFGSLLHQIGADLLANPFSPNVRKLLLSINPASKDRFPKSRRRRTGTAPDARRANMARRRASRITRPINPRAKSHSAAGRRLHPRLRRQVRTTRSRRKATPSREDHTEKAHAEKAHAEKAQGDKKPADKQPSAKERLAKQSGEHKAEAASKHDTAEKHEKLEKTDKARQASRARAPKSGNRQRPAISRCPPRGPMP